MTQSSGRPGSPPPEDGLKGIVGAGRSRVPDGAATRAREVSAPTAADLARAERTVVVRRAHPTAGRT